MVRRVPVTRVSRSWKPALHSALVLAIGPTVAQTQNLPARIHLRTEQIDVQTDGTATDLIHIELQVLTAPGVNALGQLPIPYVGSMQDIAVLEAYTQKPDGRKFAVDQSAMITRQRPSTSTSPLFTDNMEKVIVFPNVEPGDTLVYTARRRDKATLFPGHFVTSGVFAPAVPTDAINVTISAPRNLGLSVEAHDVELHKNIGVSNNDLYTLHYANPAPGGGNNASVPEMDGAPRYFASTFKSYDDLAQTYDAMIESKASVTASIRAQADSITSGISDRREQARAIYEWVSQHVRYVAIALGQGAIIPHDAESVLKNGFGDCKDHTTLFAALLKAKGIDSRPVLINLEKGYSLSSVPTIAQLDHMITWLPEFGIYADTTAGVVPFGYLVPSEYGKPVVVIDKSQPALRQTPLLTADAGAISYHNVARLDDNMRLSSEGTTTATGAFVAPLRLLGALILARGPDDLAASMLKRRGFANAKGTLIASPAVGIPASYSISSKFSVPNSVNVRMMEPGLRLMPATGDLQVGALLNTKIKDADPAPCYSEHTSEDLALEFPSTRYLVRLPQDADVKTANLHYTSRWSVNGHTLSVHREFISNTNQALCSGDLRKQAAAALAGIRQDQAATISLAVRTGQAPVTVSLSPTEKLVNPAPATAAENAPIIPGGPATSKDAPHIDSLRLGYERLPNDGVVVTEEFVFHSPKGNAATSHLDVISTSRPVPNLRATDGTIEATPDQQQRGALHTRRFTCGRLRTPLAVVERATIIDADGKKSNAIDFTIRCPGATQ